MKKMVSILIATVALVTVGAGCVVATKEMSFYEANRLKTLARERGEAAGKPIPYLLAEKGLDASYSSCYSMCRNLYFSPIGNIPQEFRGYKNVQIIYAPNFVNSCTSTCQGH